MLMQNFKSADELKISVAEQAALIKVLGMLERGELKHSRDSNVKGDFLFNMGTQGCGCGTPACIGGWVAHLLGENQMAYVDKQMDNGPLNDLYWGRMSDYITVDQAATALRSFLTVGDPRWDLADTASRT